MPPTLSAVCCHTVHHTTDNESYKHDDSLERGMVSEEHSSIVFVAVVRPLYFLISLH